LSKLARLFLAAALEGNGRMPQAYSHE